MQILKADSGYILKNGDRYTDLIYAPDFADLSMWQQVRIDSDDEEIAAYIEEKKKVYEGKLASTSDEFIAKLEEYFAEHGDGELKTLAEHRKAVRTQIDALGKVVQTAQGTGTMADPYKTWKVGMSVASGDWWMTDDGYLWMAKNSGVPRSSTDAEYWDIP